MTGADALHRALVDNLPEGLIALDSSLRVLYANSAAEDLCELSASALVGRALSTLAGADTLAALAARAAAENRSLHDEALAWPRRFGGPRIFEARVMPRSGGVTILLRERPDVLGLGGELQGAALYATLAAGIAHEVRNPLGGIRGAVQLLDAELPADSDLREHAAVALREVDRLAALVERLFDLGRPAAQTSGLNLHALLDEVIATAQRDPRAQGITFERIYDPSLPEITGDPASLGRLFHNLLRNAVDASPTPGRVRITTGFETGVRVRAGKRGKGLLRVEVSDDGPGVPHELQARLFLPFATGKPSGTGLGLALARKVATDHGGWIVYSGDAAKGATFVVYLPVGAQRTDKIP